MKSGNVQELFSYVAESSPERIAVEQRGLALSYGELDRRANRLANFLLSKDVPRGTFVAILADGASSLITSIIAALRAGVVFVPLDTTAPEARLVTLAAEVSPAYFITEAKHFQRACAVAAECAPGAGIICLDDAETVGECPSGLSHLREFHAFDDYLPRAVALDADDLCYVYFTSGSTGTPKAIGGRLKGIDHFIRWEANTFGVGEGTRVSQLTSPAFDAFLRDVFTPLCAGGTVCAPDSRETVADARLLAEWIDAARINLIHCVPSLWRSLINVGLRAEQFADLKHVLMSGEPLSPSDVGRWADIFGDRIQLVNLYGPTETTMTKFYYLVRPEDRDKRRMPIGKPMEGARALVVDARGRACSPGAVGEILIRTPYRTHGYLNRPDLTNEVFIPNPFGNNPADLVYRTGDLGRVLDDGNFEFLGRQDQQVKVRGARVELGEVQDHLRAHEAVRDVAVVDLEDTSGDKYLCAYIVANEGLSAGELREHLRGRLAEYMIPSAYVFMEALPRTISGKIDRRALPAPAEAGRTTEYVAPRTPVEEDLAGLWSEVLGLGRVGVRDNFFELGGHSLLATQLLSKVRVKFGAEVSLRTLFESPTVEGVARSIEEALKAGDELPAPSISRAPRNGPMPLSFAQQRLWFLHRMEPDSAAYGMSGAVRLTGRLGVAALERSINEIVRRHESLRTSFEMSGAEPVQVIHEIVAMRLPVTDISDMPVEEREAEAHRLAHDEMMRPFDLSQSPLFRVLLLKLSGEEHVLLYTMHHIVSDGWSMGVLIKEVAALYSAYARDEESPLAELPVQYADYAVWQRQWLQGEVLEKQLDYWRKQLAGAPAVLELPTERQRSAARSYDGAIHKFVLSQPTLKALKELSGNEGATPFMLLLASFETLLHKHTGQEDIVVGTDIANRNRSETEGLIGFFINQLALRTDMSGNPSFRELLRRVREMTLGAYAHQDLPFDKLVEELEPERSLSHTPLFQVLFVVQNAPSASLQLPGLTLSQFELDEPTSKFDLVSIIMETEEGLSVMWRYSTDLFDGATVERLARRWETLLGDILARPDERLSKLEMLSQEEKDKQKEAERKRGEASFSRFKNLRPKPVSLPDVSMVKTSLLPSGSSLPLVIEPNDRQVDIAEWIKGERQLFDSYLLKHGALLFRGFSVRSASAFERFASAVSPHLYTEYGDLPRQEVSGRVYASTPYPSDRPILFHNESSHMPSWPMRIMFCCLTAPVEGGETPIADCREVYRRLNPQVREELARRGVMYVRNFTDGLDVSWQEFFRTEDRAEAEQRCREMGLEWEWRGEGGLRTRKVRKAVARHPVTGEEVLFNQVQAHHVSFLEGGVRESLMRLFGEEGLPRNVYYGDGGVIEDEVMEEIREAYEGAAVDFKWEEGDVLVVDNMLTAHGRRAYKGERKIVVAMGEMVEEGEMERETIGATM